MNIDAETARKLMGDVQVAHRVVVGFYERLMPRLDHIAESMELEFFYWQPLYTSRPAMSTTRPSQNSLWDMVPLYASMHVYRRVEGGNLRAGDKAAVFNIQVDEGFKTAMARGKPDPIEFAQGNATLRIDLYRATSDVEETFDAIWNKAKTADPAKDGWHKVADCMEGRSIRMPLEEFMSDHESTARTLRELLFPTGDADNGSGQVDRP